jgi:hypothetical protein
LADTRSGDGWIVLKTHSVICYPGSEDSSGPYDIDAKGSPDGTKIAFISNYDLKNGAYTEITKEIRGDQFVVKSTKGFPEQGRLVAVTGFHREVLSYDRKTDTTFEGLKRGLYGTPVSSPEVGQILTSFETRLISRDKWDGLPLPAKSIREIIPDEDSPLRKQRSSDIYVAVVRLPDRPFLRKIGDHLELIPGENHWETYGYHIYRGDRKITKSPIRPGTFYTFQESASYSAVAVEWSGLESEKSFALQIEAGELLRIREDEPSDFTWTTSRCSINGKVVTMYEMENSSEAVKEIVHRYDGVIHKEWYNWGQIVERHDLNLTGFPTRKLYYQNGTLSRREYHNEHGGHISTEYFDPEGYITESVQYNKMDGELRESSHWWYQKGAPIKNISRGAVFEKDGSRWVRR